jgi:hypothetical protein
MRMTAAIEETGPGVFQASYGVGMAAGEVTSEANRRFGTMDEAEEWIRQQAMTRSITPQSIYWERSVGNDDPS